MQVIESIPASKPKEAVARAVANKFLGLFANDGKTNGFKQHILREEDVHEPTRIELSKTGVKFVSNSGTSETNWSSKSVS